MSTLYVVATPIGNRGDITLRALSILEQVHLVLAEDTRMTRKLFSLYPDREFEAQVLRLDEHVVGIRLANIVDQIAQGADAALVSDAGTPQVSDPGYLFIRECVKRGISIVPVPGPSAVTTLLSVADFPVQPMLFYGFLPKKKGRETSLRRLLEMSGKYGVASVVIYESPERVVRTLVDLENHFGPDAHLVVGRELTKQYEEVWYGTLAQAKQYFTAPRGEFSLILQLPENKRAIEHNL